jgi:hypothetical protein
MIWYQVLPLRGLGPIAFGMAEDEVHAAIEFPPTPVSTGEGTRSERFLENLYVHYDRQGRVERIAVARGGDVHLYLDGQDVFRTKLQYLTERIARNAAAASAGPQATRCVYPSLELELEQSGDADPRRRYVMGLQLARAGYFSARAPSPSEPHPSGPPVEPSEAHAVAPHTAAVESPVSIAESPAESIAASPAESPAESIAASSAESIGESEAERAAVVAPDAAAPEEVMADGASAPIREVEGVEGAEAAAEAAAPMEPVKKGRTRAAPRARKPKVEAEAEVPARPRSHKKRTS